jgi:CRISPR-associated endonuclease/helicase Cas3
MCQAHRDDVIARLRMRLAQKQNVICVSTQLIEAGVDISFECVIRDVAGLDSIYQAAGRCNRHGEYGEVKDVYVVKVAGENLDKLSGIKAGAEVTMRLYNEQNLDIDCFYRYYFFDRRMQMDYPLKPNGSILDLLTCNQQGRSANMMYRGCKNQVPLTMAIRSAAKNFYVIDRGRKDVVVPYIMDGVIKVDELMEQLRADISVTEKRGVLRELCKYTISLYKYQLHALEHKGALSCDNGVQVLAKGFYDSVIGVDIEGNHEFLCV